MKIRVLHVIDHLGYGGAPFVVKNIVERVPADLIESRVCALRANPRPIPLDAPVINLQCRKYHPGAVRAIAAVAANHRIDIIHAHLQKAVVCSLLARKWYSSRLILHEHGPIFRGGAGCIYRLLLGRLGPRADAIIANSEATKAAVQAVLSRGDIPITVVANFIDMSRFDPDSHDRNVTRQSLGLGDDEFVVGFVGRLDRAKGVDLLIDAAAILNDASRGVRIVIVGDGPERNRLEQQVRRLGLDGVVVLAGLQENTAAVMRAFDAGVVPSRREAFGIAALEMMRMKVPVIVSPVGGLPELVRDGQTGLVLARLDAGAIAQCVRRLEHDDALRASLTRDAFEHARSFDGRREVQQIVDIYERLMSAGEAQHL
jgi:glycosyltransferase involved in cell wall biosynthesis